MKIPVLILMEITFNQTVTSLLEVTHPTTDQIDQEASYLEKL